MAEGTKSTNLIGSLIFIFFSALPNLQCETKTNIIKCVQCNKDMSLGSDLGLVVSQHAPGEL